MENKKDKVLEDVEYEKEIERPKEKQEIKTKIVSRNNHTVNKNSHLNY